MATLGDAYIEVHADTGPFDRELVAAIEAALIRAEATMRQHGRDAGNAFSDGVETAVRDRADDIGNNLAEELVDGAEEGARRASAAIRQGLGDIGDGQLEGFHLPIDIDDDGLNDELGRARRGVLSWVTDLSSDISTGLGGTLSSLGKLGSNEFQVPALAVGITALVGGIIGLAQVLNPAIALLSTIPGLLTVIGVVALSINAIFGTLGKQASAVFNAKTVEEFAAAIAGLSPAALAFITLLGRIKAIWEDIGKQASEAFLTAMGKDFDRIVTTLAGPIRDGVIAVATALGSFFKDFGVFLESPRFKTFVEEVFPAVARIVGSLGRPLLRFFDALVGMMLRSMPFLEGLFTLIGFILDQLTDFINKSIKNGSFDEFLASASGTLSIIGQILIVVVGMVKDLLAWLNESGEGDTFLTRLLIILRVISNFLSSDEGHEALAALMDIAIATILVFTVLVLGILRFLAKAHDFVQWIVYEAIPAIGDFFVAIGEGIVDAFNGVVGFLTMLGQNLGAFFSDVISGVVGFFVMLGQNLAAFFGMIGKAIAFIAQPFIDFFEKIRKKWEEFWRNAGSTASSTIDKVVAFVKSLPGKIGAVFTNAASMLYNAGKNIISGLINGIKDAIPGLTSLFSSITSMIPSWKGPETKDLKLLQPAGQALMEGLGIGIKKGAAEVLGDLSALTGMISVTANPNTFNFGRGAIQQTFTGNPTPAVATSMGNATGTAIANTVNNQTMRATMRAA